MEDIIRAELAKLAEQEKQALSQLNAIMGAQQILQQLLEPEKKETANEAATNHKNNSQ